MIGIIGAMDIEIEKITAAMSDVSSETISGITYTRGFIGGTQAVAAVCGIGKVFAAVCAQTMILKYAPDYIINTGVAGTLTDKLSVLGTAIATDLVQHDMDTTPLGDPPGLLSGINIVYIKTDETLNAIACKAVKEECGDFLTGTIASGDCFVASKEKKEFITNTFGAIACEMEGASIGHVCYLNNVPFTVIRSISDSADGSADMDYSEFRIRAAASSSAAVISIIKEVGKL